MDITTPIACTSISMVADEECATATSKIVLRISGSAGAGAWVIVDRRGIFDLLAVAVQVKERVYHTSNCHPTSPRGPVAISSRTGASTVRGP